MANNNYYNGEYRAEVWVHKDDKERIKKILNSMRHYFDGEILVKLALDSNVDSVIDGVIKALDDKHKINKEGYIFINDVEDWIEFVIHEKLG
jgi:nitrogen regulatory protein PII